MARRGAYRCVLLFVALAFARVVAASAHGVDQPVRYGIVLTGDELLAGQYADQHAPFITRTLRPLGLQCVAIACVGDRSEDIKRAVAFVAEQAPLVIVTGGLGPTKNDVTRQALAEFTGVRLEENSEVVRRMEQRYGVSRERLRENLRRQALTPAGGGYLPNENGSAVGLVFETPGRVIVALPGPPRELQPMVREALVPYLSRRFGTHQLGCSVTLRFVGIGQSQIDETLRKRHLLPDDVMVASQFDGMRVDFTFSLPEDTAAARKRLERLKEGVAEHLGRWLYGEGDVTLEQRVVELLAERGEKLALAEAGSGAGVAAALLTAPRSGDVIAACFAAPTEDQLEAALAPGASADAARCGDASRLRMLAEAARRRGGAQWALAVGQPRSEVGGAARVRALWVRPDGSMQQERFPWRGRDVAARQRLVTQLLDKLRRELDD